MDNKFMSPVSIEVGQMWNERYQINSVIGEGTFGKAIKALDWRTSQQVAVKYIKDTCEANLEDVKNEVEIITTLRSSALPSKYVIVSLLDQFVVDGHPCLVFEYLPFTLGGLLKKKDMNEKDIQFVGYSLLEALDFLSVAVMGSGVVHGDLKPENIMLSPTGQLKLVDFGFSFIESQRNIDFCQTRQYRAPEVFLYLNFGCPIDVWSLGCILAECHRNKQLFNGKSELHHLQVITEVLGMIPDEMIESCPVKSGYFTKEKEWKLKDSGHRFAGPETKPMGAVLKIKKTNKFQMLLLDLLKKMLIIDPKMRIRPNEAMKHPFFADFNKDVSMTDMAICQF